MSSKFGPRLLKRWQAYAFAIAATAATLAVRFALDTQLGGQPALVIFTVPIMLSAYLGGLRAGLLATGLTYFAASYFLLSPIHSFRVASEAERWQQFLVALAGVVISVLNEALHRARFRVDQVNQEQYRAASALRVSEAALQESESRYRAVVEWSPEALIVRRGVTLVFVNAAAVKLFGASSPGELIGKSIVDLIHPDSRQGVLARMKERDDDRAIIPMLEAQFVTLDGTTLDVEASGTRIVFDGEPAVLGALHDISHRKAHEIEVGRLNRLYSALSHVNQAIVRMPSRDELFQSVCRILVEQGGVRTAWIGWNVPETHEFVHVATAGDPDGFLKTIGAYSAHRSGGGRGPSGTAFREGRPYVCNDMLADPITLPWRDDIVRVGFRSSAAFPIRQKGLVSGVLSVYAAERDFFKDKEIALLEEAADDISFALDNLAREEQREQSNEAARESMAEASDLRDALNQHALVAITDPTGKITFVNDKFCEVSEYTRRELIGKDHRIINSGYHSKAFIRELWTTIARGDVWQGELKNTTKSGRYYWVDTTIVPFLNDDGTPRQYMAIRAVITERKEAELAVRLERDNAQRYLDTADVVLLALDPQGRIMMINRKGCELVGWTEPELLGRDWIETFIPARTRDAVRATLQTMVAGDLAVVRNVIVTKSGDERLMEWRNNTVLRDAEGNVTGTFGSGTDITERNQAVEALQVAEERMRFALQSANVGIWDMDYTTGALRWSETLEAHYGVQPGTFAGTFDAFIERVHPDDRKFLLETVGAAMKTGADFATLNRAVWPDGTVRWLTGSGRILLGAHGEPVRGIGISLDVTERHTLEAQFQQAQKMEAVGQLAGGIAHDFNNLLTAILGYCELVLLDIDADDPHRADIKEIHNAGVSAAALTRQLLAFSRKQIIEPTVLDLNEIVAHMRAMLGRLIGENVTIRLGLHPDLALVKADRGQVEQVVMNLAVNARDAMPKGGTLTIETANVELDEDYAKAHIPVKAGRYVVLTVSDTGSGMTRQVQARLFEPFFTTKEQGKGTGLGLATVHGIVARSGGSVNAYSEIGVGTSFKVYFPQADAAEEMVIDAQAPPTRPQAGTRTILVVEDADGLRELARRLLERLGYTVLVAANAEEALHLFEKNASIDVLLTDVVMPGASGLDLSSRLVALRPTLKVVYMSGYTDDAIVQHGVLNPGISLLNKPFTSDTLAQKLREVLDR